MNISETQKKVCKRIDDNFENLLSMGNYLFSNPELGFKEYNTAAFVCKKFDEMGLVYKKDLALTGVKAYIDTGKPGPTVAVLGELDAVICPDHQFANPDTGAAHVCGHHAQLINMFGVGIGLSDSAVLEKLCGKIVLFATPAEEPFEAEYRSKLKEAGKIKFTCGGKQELIRQGEFDDIDMALFVHTGNQNIMRLTSNAFVSKQITFYGRESHAGNSPHRGVNALNAAVVAWTGINALRETFEEENYIRVHGIMPQAGTIAISVPDKVTMELIVRANTLEKLKIVNAKIDNALKAGALAIGTEVEINDTAGFLPLKPNEDMAKLFENNFKSLLPSENYKEHEHFKGGFDMGDVGYLIPQVHPMLGGIEGNLHERSFKIVDEQMVYANPAKLVCMTIIDLLENNAELAKEIIKDFKPKLTKQGYIDLLNDMTITKEYNFL